MAAMTSKFNFECVIQYYTDQWCIPGSNTNKTPAKAFTPPAEKKIGRRKKEEKRWSFVEEVNE